MGCLITKAPSSQYSNTGIRNIRIGINSSHGRGNPDHPSIDDPVTDTIDGANGNDKTRTLNGRHVTNRTSRDRNMCLSPKPPLTGPPTPEADRLPFSVHYAEDLQCVSPLPDVITVATLQPNRNKVNVSNVKMRQPELQKLSSRGHTMLSNNDVTIEDLDSELDQLSKYSSERYPLQIGESINPSVTDVLLPRRKMKLDLVPGSASLEKPKVSENVKKDKKKDPKKTKGKKKKKRQRPEQSIQDSKQKFVKTLEPSSKTEETVLAELEVTTVEKESVKITNEAHENELINSTTTFGVDNEKSENQDNHKATVCEARVLTTSDEAVKTSDDNLSESRVSSSKSMESSSVIVPKDMYQKELEKERLKRKRKHVQTRDRRPNKTNTIVNQGKDIKTEEELKAGLKARPVSASSVWTLESTNSFLSQTSVPPNDTFIMPQANVSSSRADIGTPPSRFSYVPSGTTPISFKKESLDQDAHIVDLESEHDFTDSNADNTIVSARTMDPFYGVKPYQIESEVLDKNNKDRRASGSSTSFLFTKQKLLYSRFARRPNSETYPRLEGKPPLPPGSTVKMRPSSETNRGHTSFSRYFTSDLDIH